MDKEDIIDHEYFMVAKTWSRRKHSRFREILMKRMLENAEKKSEKLKAKQEDQYLNG